MAIFYQPPEPRQAYPKVLPVTQGAQPRPNGPVGGYDAVLTAIGVWAALAATPMPVQKPLNVAPVTLVYGSQPSGNSTAAQRHLGLRVWQQDFRSPQTLQGTAAWNVVAQIQSQVPFTRPFVSQTSFDWVWQSETDSASWNVPAVVSVRVPFARLQPAVDGLSWIAQSEGDNAPWNIPAVVNNPPPFARLQFHLLAPAIRWDAQAEGDNAPWNIPPVVTPTVPNFRLRPHIIWSWVPPAPSPQRLFPFVTTQGVIGTFVFVIQGGRVMTASINAGGVLTTRVSGGSVLTETITGGPI